MYTKVLIGLKQPLLPHAATHFIHSRLPKFKKCWSKEKLVINHFAMGQALVLVVNCNIDVGLFLKVLEVKEKGLVIL